MRSGEKLKNNEQEFVNNLDSALSKMPNYEGTVYRSLSSDMIEDIEIFWELHQQGNRVIYNSFTSSSIGIYDETMDIQFIIKSKHGKDIRIYNQNEQETLFSRISMFKIIGVDGNTVYMEEI